MSDGYDQTLSGLLRKRAELAGQLEAARLKWEAIQAALDAIDRAVLVFEPNFLMSDLPSTRPPPVVSIGTNDMQRALLDMLRRTGKPVKSLEAAAAMMAARSIDPQDRVAATLIRKRVTDAFGRLRMKGFATSRKYGSGTELEWSLVGSQV